MTNKFVGLAKGSIGRDANSLINVIANEAIEMGSAVSLVTTIPDTEILPRVDETDSQGELCYGIAVGGDADGIFSESGAPSGDDSTRAASGAGQSVNVVTQGRCPARVNGVAAIVVGAKLTPHGIAGVLQIATGGDQVVAIALQPSTEADDIIAVDVQQEGVL